MSYECKITVVNNPYNHPEWEAVAKERGWDTYCADRGEALNPTEFIFVANADEYLDICKKVWSLSDYLTDWGYKLIRQKVYMIVFDSGEIPSTNEADVIR